jgi:MFS transporter, PAT family, beta-lactamase induction signal transducer AmpG
MANPLDHPGSHHSDFSKVRAWPAPWVFGVLILPLGMYIGFIWTALPFLLSKAGIPVEGISRIAAILQIPPLLMFLWTPVVDVKLRRRTWLVLAAVSSSICVFFACPLIGPSHFNLLTALLFLGGAVLALVFTSCGGLMATMLSPSRQAKAAAWNQAGNFGGGVLGAAVVLWLAQRVPLHVVGLAMATLMLLPALSAFTISEPPPVASHWFRGRFREMGRECLAVMRSPRRRWSVLLLIAPGCTCAAQPLLPALASHYGVDANGVLWINGVAGGTVLAAGSLLGLLVPGEWDRRLTYAGAGFTNALSAIILLPANRPSFYLAGTLMYLLTAGFCNARYVALALDVVGPDISDASTWFGALVAIGNIPIVSMIWLEGRMFHHFGAHGLLWTDAAGNLLVFAVVVTVFLSRGSRKVTVAIVPTTKRPGPTIPAH